MWAKESLTLKKITMSNAHQFRERLKLEKQASELLKASNDVNDPSIQHLLNNGTQRHASGKLEEYRRLLKTCKFKLVVYWRVDKWNREYTLPEKKAGKNKRPIPSVDRVGKKIDEELALNTLIDKCLNEYTRMDSAQIYLIDKINGVELMIFKFNVKNIAASDFREMEFKTNEFGNRFYVRMIDEPIRTDKIRTQDEN